MKYLIKILTNVTVVSALIWAVIMTLCAAKASSDPNWDSVNTILGSGAACHIVLLGFYETARLSKQESKK